MTEDKEFRDYVLSNPNLYLAFKNEWDIYSGLCRNDGSFLQEIADKTYTSVGAILNVPCEQLDSVLIRKGQAFSFIEDRYRKILASTSLSSAEKAAVEDSIDSLALDAEVKPIEDYIKEGLTPDIVERYLFILGRVYRNSDGISNDFKALKKTVFESILLYYSNSAFYSIDYIAIRAENAFRESGFEFSDSQEKALLKLISDFSPLVAQVSLTDSIGHKSMTALLRKRLDGIQEDIETNQFLAFILVFVLADIDLDASLGLIKGIMSRISIPVLKTMLYLKLNYYMAFKAGGRKTLQNSLSGMIKEQHHSMDNTIPDSSQQKSLHESRKRSNTQALKGKL